MGKIFKATTKVAKERGVHQLNGEANHTNDLSVPALTGKADHYDFMKYSLNPSAATALGKRESEMLSHPSLPTRKVELDFSRLDPHLVMLNESDQAAVQQYQRLAAALITAAKEQPIKRVLIISTLHGDGRTCVTLNLACALAQANRRVLVVDADLARPSVLRLLGLESEAAPTETEVKLTLARPETALTEGSLLEIHPCGFKVLPESIQTGRTAGLLSVSGYDALLDRLDHHHDFILLDSAPLLSGCDTHLLMGYVDKALLVVAPDRCSASEATRAISPILPEDIFGVVFNRASSD